MARRACTWYTLCGLSPLDPLNPLYNVITRKKEDMTYESRDPLGSREGCGLQLCARTLTATLSKFDMVDMLAGQATPALFDRGTRREFEVAKNARAQRIK